MLDILRQGFELDVFGDALHTPRLGNGLKHSDQHFSRILLVVITSRWLSQHGQILRQVCYGLGNHVKVLRRMQGHIHTAHPAHFPAPHSGAIHQYVTGDPTRVRNDRGDSSILGLNTRD